MEKPLTPTIFENREKQTDRKPKAANRAQRRRGGARVGASGRKGRLLDEVTGNSSLSSNLKGADGGLGKEGRL